MDEQTTNHYGRLCTEMYEFLHEEAPPDELEFYLSYASKSERILEALCGSGRSLIPFLDAGYDIEGVDSSPQMLEKLKAKRLEAAVTCADITAFKPDGKFDYVFITSGSVSLFTDAASLRNALTAVRDLLEPNGLLVFAVDTLACVEPDDEDYRITAQATIDGRRELTLKTKNRFDARTGTQFSPGVYELVEDGEPILIERMDFQTHLYSFEEMDEILHAAGFAVEAVYSSFQKDVATGNDDEMFLYECRLKA